MSLASKIFSALTRKGGFITEVIDKFKVSPEKKMEMRLEAEKLLTESLQKEEETFRDFILDYEGRATDIPKFMLGIRASVRPVLTYFLAIMFGWTMWYMFKGVDIPSERLEQLKGLQVLLFKLNLLSLGFWYGEKLLTRSGLVDLFNKKGKN